MIQVLRRRSVRWSLFLVGWLSLLYFLPTLVLASPLKQRIVHWLTRDIAGDVTVDHVQASWFGGVHLKHVRVRELNGNEALYIERVEVGKSLWSIWRDPRNWTKVRVTGLHADVRLRADGSNLEDLAAKILQRPTSGDEFRVHLVVNGSATVSSATTETKSPRQLDDLSLVISAQPGRASVKLETGTDHAQDSQLEIQFDFTQANAEPYSMSLDATRMPLDLPALVLGRLGAQVDSRGEVSGRCKFTGSRQKQLWTWTSLKGSDLVAAVNGWAGSQPAYIRQLSSDGQLTIQGETVEFKGVSLKSSLGTVKATCKVPLAGSVKNTASLLIDQDYRLSGQLDLARVAEQFPQLLHLRKDTRVVAGTLAFNITSRSEQQQRIIEWKVATNRIEAEHGGHVIRWQEPLKTHFVARQTSSSGGERVLEVDQLMCQAAFAKLDLSGSSRQGELKGHVNLDRLRQDLQHIVDLSDVELAGQLHCGIRWHFAADNRLKVQGSLPPARGIAPAFRLQHLNLRLPGWRNWQEPELLIAVAGSGTIAAGQIQSIDKLAVSLYGQRDQLEASLLTPIAYPTPQKIELQGQVRGQVKPWQNRLQLFTHTRWRPEGVADVQFAGSWTAERISIRSLRAELKQFQLDTPHMRIREPLIRFTGRGHWDRRSQDVWFDRATFASGALALATEKLRLNLGSLSKVHGRVGFRGELDRLQAWFPQRTQTWPKLAGKATGELSWRMLPRNPTAFSATGNIHELQLRSTQPRSKAGVLWSERQVVFQIAGSAGANWTDVKLQQLSLDGDRLQLRASGGVKHSPGGVQVATSGRVAYDLRQWQDELRRLVGNRIELAGAQTRDFSLQGTLGKSDWSGQFSFGWQRANVYGVPLSENAVQLKLAGDRLQVVPLQLPVSGGKLSLAGHLPLQGNPWVFVLRNGPLVEKVDITEQMCKTWLKYVTPLVANATRVSGSLSMDLENEPRLVLSRPSAARIAGRLKIHQARIGPSPLSRLMVFIARQAKAVAARQPLKLLSPKGTTWVVMPAQSAHIVSEKGRVRHDKLKFQIGDVEVTTSGSVGMDQSLDLVAEIPIPDDWRTKNTALRRYPHKSLRIPIQGSLKSPRSDKRALLRLAAELAPGGLEQLLDKQIKRGLEKLFK